MAKRNGKKRRRRRSSFGRSVALLVVASLLVVALLLVVSTCKRKKAAAQALWDGSWYADELGRVQDEKELISGLKAFYRRTGERPFLAMLGNLSPEDLDVYTEDLYAFSMQVHASQQVAYLTGTPDDLMRGYSEYRFRQQHAEPETLAFIDFVYSQPLIRAV